MDPFVESDLGTRRRRRGPRKRPPSPFKAPLPPAPGEQLAEWMRELPAHASRATRLVLIDRDLPTTSGSSRLT